MNFKQKLGYMFIGSLFTIVGYILIGATEDGGFIQTYKGRWRTH